MLHSFVPFSVHQSEFLCPIFGKVFVEFREVDPQASINTLSSMKTHGPGEKLSPGATKPMG